MTGPDPSAQPGEESAGGVVQRVNRSTREPYTLHWSAPAKRAISKELPQAVAAAALELILGALRDNPRQVGKPLHAPMNGVWSARRAMYRVLYRIDDDDRVVIIEAIRHRRSAYR